MDFLFPAYAYAETVKQTPSLLASILPLIVLFVIFYFLLIRPEQKKRREHEVMIKNLQIGNVIVTRGGVIGTIEKLDEETITIKVAGTTKLKILKEYVSALRSAGEKKKEGKE